MHGALQDRRLLQYQASKVGNYSALTAPARQCGVCTAAGVVGLWERELAPRGVRAREGLGQCSILLCHAAWYSSTLDSAGVRAAADGPS